MDDMPEFLDEMEKELEKRNFQKVSDSAHKSKSLASYLGCTTLRKYLMEIEHNAAKEQDVDFIDKKLNEASLILDRVIPQLKTVELS